MQSDKPKIGLGRGLGALIGPAAGTPMTFHDSSPASSEEFSRPSFVDGEPIAPVSSASTETLSSGQIHTLDPEKIRVNAEQPRTIFADDALDELAESIREHGILQPLVVTETGPGEFELIAGERILRGGVGEGERSRS
ncbi:chromosome partitioning protein ParB, partial [bacterium]|nr:chromosome partitioning protein ParB [bacterium]